MHLIDFAFSACVVCLCLSNLLMGAYVSDLNPKIYLRYFDCKKVLAMMEHVRSQNPDLVRYL